MTEALEKPDTLLRRASRALPFAIVAVLYGAVSDAWILVAIVLALLALACGIGPRLSLGVAGGRVGTIGVVTLGFALSAALTGATTAGRIAPAWSGICAAALLAACLRLLMKTGPGGYRVTAAVGVVAMVACGQTSSGGAYVVAVAAYLLSSLEGLRADDPGRPSWRVAGGRARVAAAAMIAIVAALTAVGALTLPVFHDWVQRKFELAYAPDDAKSGFTDRLWLGSMRGMLQSDEVVLRVRGPKVDYLRGVAYDRYAGGRWSLGRRDELRVIAVASGEPSGDGVVEIERVAGEGDRLFLPFDAARIATATGAVRVDAMGIVRRAAGDPGELAWFSRGPRDALEPSPPSEDDSIVPKELRALLERRAAEWTQGATTTAQKIAALEDELRRGATYSLSFSRPSRVDPVAWFLTQDKRGHCEYFASALALLGRAAGIPTRVIAGYRVAEKNRLGGYYVVRERNAHAWVEAWIDGVGWKTFDATPAEVVANEEHDTATLAAVGDLLRSWWTAAKGWTLARTPFELISAAAGLTILFFGYRWVRARRAMATAATREDLGGHALPCLAPMLDALAHVGVRHTTSEPLEVLAARIDRVGGTPSHDAADLLRRYAALRYGGIGDLGTLAREMTECARRLSRA